MEKRTSHNKGVWKHELGHMHSWHDRACETCGKVFQAQVRKIVVGGGRFCSKPCNPAYPKPSNTKSEKSRRYNLKSKYGITEAQFEEEKIIQENRCFICDELPNWKRDTLVVDHCHETGKYRALLCVKCNLMLGCSRDTPAILRKAADYLEQHKVPA